MGTEDSKDLKGPNIHIYIYTYRERERERGITGTKGTKVRQIDGQIDGGRQMERNRKRRIMEHQHTQIDRYISS